MDANIEIEPATPDYYVDGLAHLTDVAQRQYAEWAGFNDATTTKNEPEEES